MEETITLVNLWADFARKHPNAKIEDFCRHFLIQKRENQKQNDLVGGIVPIEKASHLMKLVGRLHKLHISYVSKAFESTPLTQIEEFGLMATIKAKKNPIKAEIFLSNLLEPSSGTDMLNRLKTHKLIKERRDTIDKRAKRVVLTKRGIEVFTLCKERINRLAFMMLQDLPEDDLSLCIQLLSPVETKYAALMPKHKGKSFEEVYNGSIKTEKT